MADVAMGRQQTSVRVGHPDDARQLRRFHRGDLLDRVQADIDSLDRVVLTVAVPGWYARSSARRA
jgi:ABC-type transport system involved in cytochrome bd biosynthesis fused ATPase/permease subunit